MPKPLIDNRRVICNVVIFSTYVIIAAITTLLWLSVSFNNTEAYARLLVCGVAFLYIAATHVLARRGHNDLAAYLLLAFYACLASGIVWAWGVNTPLGLLIFGLVIVLAGILLSARYSLFAAILSSLILVGIQVTIMTGWYTPDLEYACNASSFGDIIAYSTVFCMLSVISWLYNREIERSLRQAKEAEAALLQQKATLKEQVKERTAELRQVQLEEMRHMYRFAELGQLGVTMLHDLANHLTALTLEIDSLQSKQHAKAIAPARRIIRYLDDIVASTRDRLHGQAQEHTFNIVQKIDEALAFLYYKAAKADVEIIWRPPAGSWEYKGDPACLCQIVALITSNAIDAYPQLSGKKNSKKTRRVTVDMERDATHITIHVSDWGKGVQKTSRKQIFKPFHSTKKSGLGLGLFIARQTVEKHFNGTITLNPQTDHTEFIIKLPLEDAK